jgi:hypothetical protein
VRDGNWYADLINEGRDIRALRDRLLFGAAAEAVAVGATAAAVASAGVVVAAAAAP